MKIRKDSMLPPPAKINNGGWVTFAVIAVLAIIGFGFTACDDSGG